MPAPQFTTKQQLIRELHLCGQSPVYFIDNYCKIPDSSPGGAGPVPFRTYDFQQELLQDILTSRRHIIVKARQMGISTVVAAYCAWLLLFHRDQQIVVVAIDFKTSKNLLKKVKYILKYLPPFFGQLASVSINNRTSVVLTNGSEMNALASNDTAGRSDALSLLILDEAAHIDNIDEIWGAAKPTLSKTGGKVIAISCVVKDTYVFTDKGIQQVEDFIKYEKQGDYILNPYRVFGRDKLRSGLLFHNNGKTKTKKIITKYSELEGSLNHKLWSYSNNKFGWNKLEDLRPGDYIPIQYGMMNWGNNDDVSDFNPQITSNHKNIFNVDKITSDLSYVLGLFLAEGSSYIVKNKDNKIIGYDLTFTCGDPIKDSLVKGLNIDPVLYDGLHHKVSSKSFGEFLEYLGFDLSLKAPNKKIPKRLLQMSAENIRALIQGIFDGDGYSRSDKGTVGIGLSSKDLIEQIRMILLNFGILSVYSKTITKPTKLVKVSSVCHRLDLDGRNSKKFYELIGFRFQRKQNNENVLKEKNLSRSRDKDVIPGFVGILKEVFCYYPKGTEYLRKHSNLSISKIVNQKTLFAGEVSRDTALKLYKLVQDNIPSVLKGEIEKNLQENIAWVKIKDILNGEAETYDFSLPDKDNFWDHSILYNGIIGHQTPAGMGNWFHDIWEGCTDKEHPQYPNGWKGTFLHWSRHPDRDEEWFREETKDFSPRFVAQEYEGSFLASGETFISGPLIKKLTTNASAPIFTGGFDGNLWFWELYDPKEIYLISADVARGDGADYSSAHIWKVSDMTQVAEYKGKLDIEMFANLLMDLGNDYGGCLIAVENATLGHEVSRKMWKSGYKNVYWHKKGTQEYVSQPYAEDDTSCVLGFTITSANRHFVLNKFEEYVRLGVIGIKSHRFIEELKHVIWDHGRVQAQKGKNDDLTMAAAIGCWIRDTVLEEHHRLIRYKKDFAKAIQTRRRELNTHIPGMIGYNRSNASPRNSIFKSEYQKQRRQYSWLYKG